MHVALAVLPACVSITVFHSRWFRLVTVVLVSAIILSTLTLKKHYVLDAVAGLLLGTVSFVAWESDFGSNVRPVRKGACNEPAEKVPV
jgi:membrane-associated phospholipid phosphatase